MSFAMSRAFASGTPRTVARCSSGAARVVAPVQRAMVHRSQRRAQFVVRATEEAVVEEATSTAQESNSSDDLGPIARARAALEAESLDRPSLESVVDELESELARLQNAAAAAEARAAGLESAAAQGKDQLLRLNADFENFRRRTREEKDALAASVKGDIVTNLLPVVDNFELARTQVKAESEAEQKIQNSYQALYKQFVEFLRNLGVEAVPTVGTPFDPNFHEAIMQEPNNDMADNTVLMEFRKGFKLGDKLLRPAMVKVSTNDGTGPSSTESPTEGSSEE